MTCAGLISEHAHAVPQPERSSCVYKPGYIKAMFNPEMSEEKVNRHSSLALKTNGG